MFGYIRILPEQLRLNDAKMYRSMYCGLCHQIAEYSQFARFFLSFDMVFFTILSAYDKKDLAKCCVTRKCIKKVPCPDEIIDYWAAMSILIIYHKLLNDVEDGEKIKKIYVMDLHSGYKKAKEKYPVSEQIITDSLKQIELYEERMETNPENMLEIFGNMMGDLLDEAPCGQRSNELRTILRRIAYGISKWLYAMDFYDDVEKDKRHKQYNPLVIQQSQDSNSDEVLERFCSVINGYAEELQHLCSFLPYDGFHDIVVNVLHEGIVDITAKVYGKQEKKAHQQDSRR